ncbi:hypothetical protein SNE40_019099 [Patella caerulea]|uniref:VWFC domain-containing protein n=1 Tax=Patella caerulea TaxID=87958 RepID=A0AAN8J998_PATCE
MLLFVVSIFMLGSYGVLGQCEDRDFDEMFFRDEGQTWIQGCDVCVCKNTKITCSGGPKCTMPFSEDLKRTCLRWTDDKCCCLKEGCRSEVDHKEYNFGDFMPMDQNGCKTCRCEAHSRGICKYDMAKAGCSGVVKRKSLRFTSQSVNSWMLFLIVVNILCWSEFVKFPDLK